MNVYGLLSKKHFIVIITAALVSGLLLLKDGVNAVIIIYLMSWLIC